jgi:hypothetical protein
MGLEDLRKVEGRGLSRDVRSRVAQLAPVGKGWEHLGPVTRLMFLSNDPKIGERQPKRQQTNN